MLRQREMVMRRTMAQVRRVASVNESSPLKDRRALVFSFGDALFLMLVGVVVSLVMYMVHSLMMHLVYSRTSHLIISLIVGMSLAMIIQILLAFGVAPILGSIESMVPSMVVAMILPMVICTLALMGITLSRTGALALGTAGGIGIFILIKAYGCKCKKALCCEFTQKDG